MAANIKVFTWQKKSERIGIESIKVKNLKRNNDREPKQDIKSLLEMCWTEKSNHTPNCRGSFLKKKYIVTPWLVDNLKL